MPENVNTPINHTIRFLKSGKRNVRWPDFKPKEYWDYRDKWNKVAEDHVVGELPIHLDIETTNLCNMQCVQCPRTVQVENNEFGDQEFMSFDLYKDLIDQAVEGGVCSIKLNFLGEPLLHSDLGRQISYARKRGIIDIIMNTNAKLLTEEKAKEILAAGVGEVSFSFDSANKENYEKIRVGGNFEEVVGNIKNFVHLRDELQYYSVVTRASMTRMKDNLDECDEFLKMWEPIVDVVSFITYQDRVGSEENKKRHQYWEEKEIDNFCCPQPFQRMQVMVDGSVTACCSDISRGKWYPLGNAKEQSLKEIWSNENYRYLRQCHKENSFEKIEMCKKCPFPYLPKEVI